MIRTGLSITALLIVTLGYTLLSQGGDPPNIVGVWKLAEVTREGPKPMKITNPEAGFVIFTRRHYSISQVTADKPRPELPPKSEATDKQRADAYEPFTGQAGTYEIKGDEIIVHPMSAMNPNLMKAGTFTIVKYTLDAKTLTITFSADHNGPIANKPTMKYTRVE